MLALAVSVAQAGDVVEYLHLDALGNVRVITDQNKNVIERHDYFPFGEECTTGPCASNPGAGFGQPRKFTGKERDAETGHDYFGARYYASTIGRFTTVDPAYTWRENLIDPQRWNRYAYGSNNPLRYVDPDGRASIPALIPLITTLEPPETADVRIDTAIGFASGFLTLVVPGLEIRANSEAQAHGQLVGQFAALSGAAFAARAGAQTGVQANKAAGDAWSRAVGAELKATHEIAVPEITVRTQSGARTRLDWVTKDHGVLGCVECKASSAARLTRAQATTHVEIAHTGGVVAGKGKPGVPGGTVIPPTEVQVRRPE